MKIFAITTFVLAMLGATAMVYNFMPSDDDASSSAGGVAEFELEIAKKPITRQLKSRPIRFYAMGDSPYSQTEKDNLPLQLAKLDKNADFIVHLGDMQDRYVLYIIHVFAAE